MIFCLLSLYYQYAPVCNERTDTRFLREEHGDTWPFKLAVKQSSHNLSPFSEPPEGHTAICLTDIQRPCVSEHRMFCVCVCVRERQRVPRTYPVGECLVDLLCEPE